MKLSGFEVHKLRVPAGRMIGDCGCAYEVFDVVALGLRTAEGLTGWGYGIGMSEGYFERTGWWIQCVPSEQQMRDVYAARCLPALLRLPDPDWLESALGMESGISALNMASRQAIWDLAAKEEKMPVWRLLRRQAEGGGASAEGEGAGVAAKTRKTGEAPSVPAYGSLLDFPLGDEPTLRLAQAYRSLGLRAVKVKVGAADPNRDLRRLRLVADAFGPEVQLTADANEVWDAPTCIERLRFYEKNGIRLRYIEDPLKRDDLAGYRALRGRLPCDVAGHDYFHSFEEFQRFVEAGVLDVLRSGQDTALQVRLGRLAAERRLPIYYGNSIGEMNIHAAAALPATERIEYSHLGWSALFATPVRVVNGAIPAPEGPGYGLDPSLAALAEFHQPAASEPRPQPRPW